MPCKSSTLSCLSERMRGVPKRIHITRSTKHFDGDAVYATRYSSGIIHPIPPSFYIKSFPSRQRDPSGWSVREGKRDGFEPTALRQRDARPLRWRDVRARQGWRRVRDRQDRRVRSNPRNPPTVLVLDFFVCFNLFLIISFIFSFRSCGRWGEKKILRTSITSLKAIPCSTCSCDANYDWLDVIRCGFWEICKDRQGIHRIVCWSGEPCL